MNQNPAKFCAGCGYPIILMMLARVLEKMELSKKTVLGLDIGCNLLAWNYLPLNIFQTHHGRVTPTMMGFKRARPDSISVALTGDGGAYAIGLQSLIHIAKRDEPVFVLIVNNTLYAMTGGQTAPTTLKGQKTDTHPEGYADEPFWGPELLKQVVQPGAFIARTAVNDPKNLLAYLEKAIQTTENGHFAMVEVLSFCPTNWRTKGQETLNYLENLKKFFVVGEKTQYDETLERVK